MTHSRKDIVMMGAMGALMLFAVFNFVFKPQRSAQSAARSDIARVEQRISDAELMLQAPASTSPLQAEASSSAIPADPAIAPLLRQLEAIADETGVELGSISPSPLAVNPSGAGGSLQISIAASGSHDAVLAYIAALRDLDRLAVIEQIGLTGAPASDGLGPTDQVQLSVRVFTLRPPADAPVATQTSSP